MTYYREATVHTQELLDLLVKCENKIQTVRPVPFSHSTAPGMHMLHPSYAYVERSASRTVEHPPRYYLLLFAA